MKILLELKIKKCKMVFQEGLGPGVLASKVIVFSDQNSETDIAIGVLDQSDQITKENTEVVVTEI